MSEIAKLAEASAKAAEYYQRLGTLNAYGQTPEDRASSSARYRMARDAWLKAESDYRDAINGLSAGELSELAKR